VSRPSVLVVSAGEDRTADLVSAHLHDLGASVSRWDVADFPSRLVVDARLDSAAIDPGARLGWSGTLTARDGLPPIDLTRVCGVYYRKPTPFRFPDEMTAQERRFAELEARAGLLGVLASVPARWINHPLTEVPAGYKPLQLARAARAGLLPPRSLVSSSPAAVRRFVDDLGGVVVHKGIGKDLAQPGEVPIPVTRTVTSAELHASDGLSITTHLFQEVIDKTHDVRVTVVGEWMCAVEIHTSSAALDWRTAYDEHEYEVVTVPPPVAAGLRSFMTTYDVYFATFDFAVDRQAAWRFLEMNANGEWLWLEDALGLGIARRLAAALAAR